MNLWRISNFNDLRGLGGELGVGRWHTPAAGKRIVYLAEHPALALIESLVNMRSHREFLPESFQLLKVEASDQVSQEAIGNDSLTPHWQEDFGETQAIGNAWLVRGETALLAVPSAPSPESINYLLNPRHPEAERVSVAWARQLRYDRRLFRVSTTL